MPIHMIFSICFITVVYKSGLSLIEGGDAYEDCSLNGFPNIRYVTCVLFHARRTETIKHKQGLNFLYGVHTGGSIYAGHIKFHIRWLGMMKLSYQVKVYIHACIC